MSDTRPKRPGEDLVFVDAEWALIQRYRQDPLQARFLAALKEKRLVGVRDPVRGLVMFPPRSLSEESFSPMTELVPVGPGGIVRTLARIVPAGKQPRPPYIVAFVQLDGADSAAAGRLRGAGSDPGTTTAPAGTRPWTSSSRSRS